MVWLDKGIKPRHNDCEIENKVQVGTSPKLRLVMFVYDKQLNKVIHNGGDDTFRYFLAISKG